jgi:hypothetical protein
MADLESLKEKIIDFDLIRRLMDSDFVADFVVMFVTMPLPRYFFPDMHSGKIC